MNTDSLSSLSSSDDFSTGVVAWPAPYRHLHNVANNRTPSRARFTFAPHRGVTISEAGLTRELRNQIASQYEDIDSLESQVSRLSAEIRALAQENVDLEKRNRDHEEENDELIKRIDEVEEQNESSESQPYHMNTRNEELVSKNMELAYDNVQLRYQLDALQDHAYPFDTDSTDTSGLVARVYELEGVKEERDAAVAQCFTLQKTNADQALHISELESELATLREEHKTREEFKVSAIKMHAEFQDIKAQRNSALKTARTHEGRIKTLQQHYDEHRETIADLKHTIRFQCERPSSTKAYAGAADDVHRELDELVWERDALCDEFFDAQDALKRKDFKLGIQRARILRLEAHCENYEFALASTELELDDAVETTRRLERGLHEAGWDVDVEKSKRTDLELSLLIAETDILVLKDERDEERARAERMGGRSAKKITHLENKLLDSRCWTKWLKDELVEEKQKVENLEADQHFWQQFGMDREIGKLEAEETLEWLRNEMEEVQVLIQEARVKVDVVEEEQQEEVEEQEDDTRSGEDEDSLSSEDEDSLSSEDKNTLSWKDTDSNSSEGDWTDDSDDTSASAEFPEGWEVLEDDPVGVAW